MKSIDVNDRIIKGYKDISNLSFFTEGLVEKLLTRTMTEEKYFGYLQGKFPVVKENFWLEKREIYLPEDRN